MSKFFVGQRVRIVGAKNLKYLNGREATIVGAGVIRPKNCKGVLWKLDIDKELPNPRTCGLAGDMWGDWQEDQLAPAYDGNEKVSWESMKELWIPQEEKVA